MIGFLSDRTGAWNLGYIWLVARIYNFMGRLGLEPRTNRLKAEYSTIELATQIN